MKNDNGVPRFTYDGTSVTCLGKYELRNSDFYELRNGCPLSIGIVKIVYYSRSISTGGYYDGLIVYKDTRGYWHLDDFDYHIRSNPIERYNPSKHPLKHLLFLLEQGYCSVRGGKLIADYLRHTEPDEELGDDQD